MLAEKNFAVRAAVSGPHQFALGTRPLDPARKRALASVRSLGSLVVALLLGFTATSRAADEPKFDAAALEFFEKEVRPILAERCYECHSAKTAEPKGGLRVDSRAAMLVGGDTGPAITPGKPEESLLIDAINYGDIYQMPPKTKMPPGEIAVLTKWVAMNAPWPPEETKVTAKETFDIQRLKAEHWCWNPIQRPEPPTVARTDWPRQTLDRFILHRLEQAGLTPSPAADKRTLIRRVYFDLIGLPPLPAEVDAFVADDSPKALEHVVDRLLDSPRFGERWARHWLDLVRYAETYGHEFDYPIPNAFRYRDYVIRAFNEDVPYNQFVVEHVAGDLLDSPRLHPTEHTDESVIGTAFWWLGEATHAPVDVRGDEAARIDNQLDVMSKTFMGLTVACARCHDHKFDAISTKDYYALAGFLQSSRRHEAWLAPVPQQQQIAEQLKTTKVELDRAGMERLPKADESVAQEFAAYLLAAREVMHGEPRSGDEVATAAAAQDIVFEDFEEPNYDGWEVTGDAFGDGPVELEPVRPYLGEVGLVGQRFAQTHVRRNGDDSRATDQKTGRLTSREFKIERSYIDFLIGGGSHAGKTCLNLLVDGKVIHSATGRNAGKLFPARFDVSDLRGQTARIEIVDDETGGWGNVGVDHIVFTNNGTLGVRRPIEAVARERKLDAARLARVVQTLSDESAREPTHPLYAWSRLAMQAPPVEPQTARALLDQTRDQAARWEQQQADFPLLADFNGDDFGDWLTDGEAFGATPTRAGEFTVTADGEVSLALPGVADSGRWARQQQGVLRSPTFTLEHSHIYYRVRGQGVRIRLILDGYFMDVYNGLLFRNFTFDVNSPDAFSWVSQSGDIGRYVGHKAYIEILDHGDGQVAIDEIRFSNGPSPPLEPSATTHRVLDDAKEQAASDQDATVALANRYGQLLREALAAVRTGEADAAQCELLRWCVDNRLWPQASSEAELQAAAAKLAQLGTQVPKPPTVLSMTDGSPENEYVHIRGNHRLLGEEAPRGTLAALRDDDPTAANRGSGRLAFARSLVQPTNPLTSRVMVNRVWHHLFGRGIVASTDNFGVLGDRPTHPELLDHLAVEFMQDGWSIKRLLRRITLSQTYQMSSEPRGVAAEVDPQNLLLHRMNIRRLQGEAIRDAMLRISGRLDESMYGPSVPVHITPFMQGRGRPGNSGPVDGGGRRSVYIEVRRNFLSPMMLAFDTPIPFNAIGRRNVSNVPAQALILMNDPFVVDQAGLWAKRLLADNGLTVEQRIERMYAEAFSRPPTSEEASAARAFLELQSSSLGIARAGAGESDSRLKDERLWSDLAHVLFNSKEFVFIP